MRIRLFPKVIFDPEGSMLHTFRLENDGTFKYWFIKDDNELFGAFVPPDIIEIRYQSAVSKALTMFHETMHWVSYKLTPDTNFGYKLQMVIWKFIDKEF